MIKTLVQKLARSLGYEIVPMWRMEDLHFTGHLRQMFGMLNIKVVLDVGANTGQYRDFLRNHVGFDGCIVSFEPVPELVATLRERASGDANWHVYPWALGSSNTEAMINVMQRSQFSSFLTPENSMQPAFSDVNVVERQERVEIKRLDSVYETITAALPSGGVYLKMDTQGCDLDVVEGASGILDRIAMLQTEVSVLPIYSDMPDYHTSLTTLSALGFDVTGMFPVSRDEYLRLIEFDCVMLNRKIGLTHRSVSAI